MFHLPADSFQSRQDQFDSNSDLSDPEEDLAPGNHSFSFLSTAFLMTTQDPMDLSHIWDKQLSQHHPSGSFHPRQFKRHAFIRPIHAIPGPFDYSPDGYSVAHDQDGLADDDHGIGEPQDTPAVRPNQLLFPLESSENQLEAPKEVPTMLPSPSKAVPALSEEEEAKES